MIDFIKDADCTKETPVRLGVPDAPIYGKGIKLKPRVDGRTDSEHFKKIYLPELLPLEEYDLIVVLISGGTNYKCNEWLDKADLKVFETMKKQNPRRYKVAGLGDWGIVDGLVYENWEEKAFSVDEVKKIAGVKSVFGLDFGYTNDPSALFCGLIDQSSKTIWVFDEMYQPGMSNEAIAEQVQRMGYVKEKITADSAEPKSIDRLRELGLKGIRKARKGKDSINNGIDFIQDYHIIIHPRCVNFITEISNYQWDKDAKTGKKLNRPIDDFNHLMDAMRYAIEQMAKGDAFSFD